MHLNEILDEHSVSSISNKTNISEQNIDALVALEFDRIKRVKTMGFISIIEREYHADLSKLKEEAIAYYETHIEDEGVTLGNLVVEPRKDKSKFFKLVVSIFIILAIWYAYINFDKEKLNAMIPVEQFTKFVMPDKDDAKMTGNAEELSIEKVHNNTPSSKNNEESAVEITDNKEQ